MKNEMEEIIVILKEIALYYSFINDKLGSIAQELKKLNEMLSRGDMQ